MFLPSNDNKPKKMKIKTSVPIPQTNTFKRFFKGIANKIKNVMSNQFKIDR